jgi:hypothetical protein
VQLFSPQHQDVVGNAQQQQQQQPLERQLSFAVDRQEGLNVAGAAIGAAAAGASLQQQQPQQQWQQLQYPCLGSPFSSPFCDDSLQADTAAPAAAAAQTAAAMAGPAEAAASQLPASAAADAAGRLQHTPQQQQQKQHWLRHITAQGKSYCSLLLCRLQAWWAQQPLLLLLLITGNFCLYVALCVIWSVMPPCQLGFFLGVGVFISASTGLAAAACWLHWRRAAGLHPSCCGHIIHLQPQQQQQKVLELLPPAALKQGGSAVGFVTSAESAVRGPAALREITLRPIDDSAHMPSSTELPGTVAAAAEPPAEYTDSKLAKSLPAENGSAVNLAAAAAIAQKAAAAASSQPPCKDCASSAVSEAGSAAVAEVLFNDIEWTRTRLLYFQPLMLLIGVASGLLGASPNTLFLTPMLIGFGQHPQVRTQLHASSL